MTICYNFASRERPAQFEEALKSIWHNCNSEDYFVVGKFDVDDAERYKRFNNYVLTRVGRSHSKIDAINRQIETFPAWDIMVNMSDDIRWIQPGFDEVIRRAFTEPDLFIHFPCPVAEGNRVAVVNITDHAYYDRLGYIYHPDYYSMFCDDEATEVAKAAGRYKFINKPLFDHIHYSNRLNPAPLDPLYTRNRTYRRDERVFLKRKNKGFPQRSVLL